MAVWVWVAQGPIMQSTAIPANWLVNGIPASTPPPNDGSVDVQVNPGTAPMQFTAGLTLISSITTPPGWGKMIQLDMGLRITGQQNPFSTLNDTTVNILNAPWIIDVAATVNTFNVTSDSLMGPIQPEKIRGIEQVSGKTGGNTRDAKGPVEIEGGDLRVIGNSDGPATFNADLGMKLTELANRGGLNVNGTSATNSGTLNIYTLDMVGGRFTIDKFGKATINGTIPTDDNNFAHASMVVKTSATTNAQITLSGDGASLTTQFGLYIGPSGLPAPNINAISFVPDANKTVTLNGDVYTYGNTAVSGGGAISSDGNITINNGLLLENLPAGVTTVSTWTCKTFTATGTTGVTVSADFAALPANTTTYKLVSTTNGANSTSGTFTPGKINGAAYPATWNLLIRR